MLKKCLWNELLNQDFNPQSPGLEVNLHQRPDPLTFMSLPQRAVRKGVQGWRHHEGREFTHPSIHSFIQPTNIYQGWTLCPAGQ